MVLRLSTCPSLHWKDSHLFAATDQYRKIKTFSRTKGENFWRTHICLQQLIIIGKYKQFLLWFSTCPSMSLKDGDLSTGTDHHRKVETFYFSVFDLSINLFEGLTSVCSNRSSSQSRKIFSFGSRSVHQFVWRTNIDNWQEIIIAKYKQFLFQFLICPSICLKEAHRSLATVHHLKV